MFALYATLCKNQSDVLLFAKNVIDEFAFSRPCLSDVCLTPDYYSGGGQASVTAIDPQHTTIYWGQLDMESNFINYDNSMKQMIY